MLRSDNIHSMECGKLVEYNTVLGPSYTENEVYGVGQAVALSESICPSSWVGLCYPDISVFELSAFGFMFGPFKLHFSALFLIRFGPI